MGSKWTYLMVFLVVATAVFVVYATQKEFDLPAPADEGSEAFRAHPASANASAGSPRTYAERPFFAPETEEVARYSAPGAESENADLSAVLGNSATAVEINTPTEDTLSEIARQRARLRAIEDGRLQEFEEDEAMRRQWEAKRQEILGLEGDERAKALMNLRSEMRRQRAFERGRLQEFEEWEARRRQREAQRERRRRERERMRIEDLRLDRERMRMEELEEEEEESQPPAY